MATAIAIGMFLLSPCAADEPDLAAEQSALDALRGIPSNMQKNRDGTVRFLRFSKPIVADEHLDHITAFSKLDYLAVVSPNVTDAGLANIADLTNLDTLFLSDCGMTDTTLAHLSGLTKLENLYLDGTQITDDGLRHVASLPGLKTLSLQRTSVGNRGLQYLCEMPTLEVLRLAGTQVTDGAFSSIAKIPNLRVLDVCGTAVDGSGLSELAAANHLESLDLSGCRIASDRLMPLVQLASLKTIVLHGVAVDEKTIAGLCQAMAATGATISFADHTDRTALDRFLNGESLAGTASRGDAIPPSDLLNAAIDRPATERFVAADDTPDFQRHVIPLLGRLGCNGRSCHGSFQGKGGFRLSMFGYDFAADHAALTGGEQPRVNIAEISDSLILRKPVSDENHGGGQRFDRGGWEDRLLRRWIEAGAPGGSDQPRKLLKLEVIPRELLFEQPDRSVALKCIATWHDGAREDVTCLTRFQSKDEDVAEVSEVGIVRCVSPGDTHVIASYDSAITATPVMLAVSDRTGDRFPHVPTPTTIDELVVDKLSRLGIVPSDVCSDADFLRRVSLDIAGTLPTATEVETFLADTSTDKRSRRINELLETPAYAEWWTVFFGDLTGSNSQYLGTTDMNSPAAQQWHDWLRRRIQDNVGWDEIAAGIILSKSRRPGQTYDEYAAAQSRLWSPKHAEDFSDPGNPMHYYWFRSNNQTPTDRALSFGYVFMGVRLQCAQCHKHPFDRWSSQDFEDFTQFFTRVKAGIAPDATAAEVDLKRKLGVPEKLDTAALRRQMYLRVSADGLPIPWKEIWIEPAGDKRQQARLPGGERIDLSEYDDPREPLAAWLLADDNPWFARAFVNRIWAHYFGMGIVDPPDDFNIANPPCNRPLLDWLAEEFVAHDYDLRWLHRTITNSRAYQLSCDTNDTNRRDVRNFARATIRRLPAEVMIDAILQATASDAVADAWATTMQNRKIGQHPKSIQTRGIDYSLLIFGKPLRTTNCDCERQTQPTLIQSLYVRNDHEIIAWLERPDGWLAGIAKELGQSLASESKAAAEVVAARAETVEPTIEQIDQLIGTAWLRTLGRRPTDAELNRSREQVAASDNTVEGLRDIMWALINTQEFLTNH